MNPNPDRIAVPSDTPHDLCKRCGRVVFWVSLHPFGLRVSVDCGEDIGGVIPLRKATSHLTHAHPDGSGFYGQQAKDGSGFLHDERLCQQPVMPDNSKRPQPTVNEAVSAKRTS